jgi:hypothetical protein
MSYALPDFVQPIHRFRGLQDGENGGAQRVLEPISNSHVELWQIELADD